MNPEENIPAEVAAAEKGEGFEEKERESLPALEAFLKKAKKETLYDWLHG